MKMSDSALARLRLDDDLRTEVDRARKVSSPIARRRAERSLAGTLRSADLDELESRLANVKAGGDAETRLFKMAEGWRERLIDETTIAADVPGGSSPDLHRLIHDARRERDTGRPRGAARALFRHVFAELKAQEEGEQEQRDQPSETSDSSSE